MGRLLWVALAWAAMSCISFLFAWLRWQRIRGAVESGEVSSFQHRELSAALLWKYQRGVIPLRALETAATMAAPKEGPVSDVLNRYICVEIAAGRYQQALAWRTRWETKLTDGELALITINEAEAMACLGQLERSLGLAGGIGHASRWVRCGALAHSIWVLAELGRLTEARALMADPLLNSWWFPPDFKAERQFSRFAVGLAARDFALAREALEKAEPLLVRESSKRNWRFYRGRLAVAEGRLDDALAEFEQGAQSIYKFQGGVSLLEWGDTLAKLGRLAEAQEKWRWCTEQDPQSPAASVARTRMQANAAA